MNQQDFTFHNGVGQEVYVYHWFPHSSVSLRGVVQIAHGMAESAKRYHRLAQVLTDQGYLVFANDHRGHGMTAKNQDELGCPGEDGFNGMISDIMMLNDKIKERHAELPLFLMGHSMGSFLTQKIMCNNHDTYDGFILTGTNGPQGLLFWGQQLAKLQMKLQGERHPSLLMNALTFGNFNNNFLPMRTPFDWLSRDSAEVDKYIEDPHCGFLCSTGFFRDFFGLLREIHTPTLMKRIPKDKPIYIFGGGQDPVGKNGTGVMSLVKLYENLQLHDVEWRLYPGGRHEMLNETNREEVTEELLGWLERHT